MRLVVSACLLGRRCRYDGGHKRCDEVCRLAKRIRSRGGVVIEACPEEAAGLPVPRRPAERVGRRVLLDDGTDVTEAFRGGARRTMEKVRDAGGAPLAVLKAKSPSCGVNLIYDGSYTGSLTRGSGVFAERLEQEGTCMTTENSVRICTPSVEHPVAIVLGTGLGHLAGLVKPVRRIAYRDIPGFPASARPVAGHSFEATVGTIDGVPVVVYPGRVHLYQGYTAAEVSSLVAHAHQLGCRVMLFACATGAIPQVVPTGLGMVSDQINLTGANPLVPEAPQDGRIWPPSAGFADMTDIYSPYLRGLARGVAQEQGLALSEGVLAGVVGPNFETPAEVNALRVLGVSYVGMSTVCEAILAHSLGMQVLGLTLAANYAGEVGVTHQSVLAAAQGHADGFERLVRGVLALL